MFQIYIHPQPRRHKLTSSNPYKTHSISHTSRRGERRARHVTSYTVVASPTFLFDDVIIQEEGDDLLGLELVGPEVAAADDHSLDLGGGGGQSRSGRVITGQDRARQSRVDTVVGADGQGKAVTETYCILDTELLSDCVWTLCH